MVQKILFIIQSALIFYYFATVLQWYSYKIKRVIFNFSKPIWHVYYFAIPIAALAITSIAEKPIWTGVYVIIYALFFASWVKKLDKKLVFTARIKRFWAIFAALLLPLALLLHQEAQLAALIFSIAASFYLSTRIEAEITKRFENMAITKLQETNPTVIAVTASFGKTSIKNFAAHILSKKFRVYATPASVNTKIGIIKDINDNLPQDTEVYVVEAGAREAGDIEEIATLVEPHYSVIGKIGEAHIEYFKTIENIKTTKSEILKSPRLKKAFAYENSGAVGENIAVFGFEEGVKIKNVSSSLDGVSFDLELNGQDYRFEAPNILGAFNAINIAASVLLAYELGMDIESIQRAVNSLPSVAHRLQKMVAAEKIILDDSFNGNLDGIKEGIALCRTHPNQKVIVTCGLVESRDELNEELAKLIDDTFDIAIVTGELNRKLFDKNLQKCEKIFLSNKDELQNLLKEKTAPNSIVYFANDAPGYI
ncbi:MAG: UDP-N-acetylmuramoyl-tripeptide--D-alanyl-D-alanine ligase [Campylobacteraceae bacterium]|jgi:UDP-N-acetylmuramoyl-tripeptide--D-alanyl-D-alanine ligase|nr:UDP-N-acetylmuramoyl-tripeptide--D-alanyl-D-alanine ligase [Campylobacteraceae bacterium]